MEGEKILLRSNFYHEITPLLYFLDCLRLFNKFINITKKHNKVFDISI